MRGKEIFILVHRLVLALADEVQVSYPRVEDLRVGLGVGLEDLHCCNVLFGVW